MNGKLSLFRPPDSTGSKKQVGIEIIGPIESSDSQKSKRVRTTLDLTWDALQVIQDLQQQHRLKTGKVLPLWKAASLAIEGFAQANKIRKADRSMLSPA